MEDVETGRKSGLMNDFSYYNNVDNAGVKIRLGIEFENLKLLLQFCTFLVIIS